MEHRRKPRRTGSRTAPGSRQLRRRCAAVGGVKNDHGKAPCRRGTMPSVAEGLRTRPAVGCASESGEGHVEGKLPVDKKASALSIAARPEASSKPVTVGRSGDMGRQQNRGSTCGASAGATTVMNGLPSSAARVKGSSASYPHAGAGAP